MGLSLWPSESKSSGPWDPVDHLSEVVPYPTIASTRTPASKVPANVMRPAAWGAALCPKIISYMARRDHRREDPWVEKRISGRRSP